MALTEARFMLVRDAVVVVFALGLGAYEVIAGGARPAVLTWITGLLVSPIVLRADRLRRNGT